MSEQLHLIATSDFPLSDQNIKKNQKFTQPKREGELLVQLGLAKHADEEPARQTAPRKATTKRAPAKKTATKRTGRRYQRRDMTAQD